MWQLLFTFSWLVLAIIVVEIKNHVFEIVYDYTFLPYFIAPVIGWLADVKFGRYEVINFGSMASILSSVFLFFALITGIGVSTLSNSLFTVATVIVNVGATCYMAAMLPFLSDQIIGATSDELGTVVRWYIWAGKFGYALSSIVTLGFVYDDIGAGVALIVAIPLAVIIISDCLCQQWLDRSHKVTNPIKLIVQVLNYTRKHSYPERRSAFTYIDEEQPTRMDYGKEKFGGPFTEEEVEDVKTVLRLLPLVTCLSLSVSVLSVSIVSLPPLNKISNAFKLFYVGLQTWLIPVVLIPFYQLLVRPCIRSFCPCIRNYSPTMLKCFGISVFVYAFGFLLLQATQVYEIVNSNSSQSYLSCVETNVTSSQSDIDVVFVCKLVSVLVYGVGEILSTVLLNEFIIAQSPDKMKGFFIGIMIVCQYISFFGLSFEAMRFNKTICYDLSIVVYFVVLLVVFLVLSKRYTLRERNREINIQAIVEEHYERYMDQEEEYMRQQHY